MPIRDMTEYRRKYYLKNKARISARARKHYEAHKEERRERNRAHYKENRDRILTAHLKYYEENREKLLEYYRNRWATDDRYSEKYRANRRKNHDSILEKGRAFYRNNAEACREVSRKYRQDNPAKRNAQHAVRRANKIRATPAWVDRAALEEVYADASAKNLTVDHIVPLKHKSVCGLHVPWNLQLLTQSENSSKNNKFLCG